MLTTEQAAYVAGIIDGEGHLGIKRTAANHHRGAQFAFVVKVTNTNHEWLIGLQQWIGGRIWRNDSKKRRNRRPCYDLQLNGAEARALLVAVQPFLRMKQRHAEIILRYFNAAARRRESNLPGRPSDPTFVAALDALYEELKSLNLRGLAQNWPTTPKQGRVCQIDGCHRDHLAKGYCKTHYKKYIERGGPAWHEAACQRCGKPFVSKRSDAVFCSRRCANTDYQRRNRTSPSPG